MSDTQTLLKQDHAAEPPAYRAADFGGRSDHLVISEGLASDHYSLVPARSVAVTMKGQYVKTTGADLESGVYSVPKLGAAPVKVRDIAPNVAKLIPENTVEAVPYCIDGIGQVHTVTRDAKTGELGMTVAVFQTADGDFVGFDVEKLPTDGAQHDSVPVPSYVGSKTVRWLLAADKEKPSVRPALFTRRAYGTSHKAAGGTDTYISGEWQAVIMPVRLAK